MSKSQDTKFNGARFEKYNRPETDLFRLKRDMYWLLSQTKGYSEENANKQWDYYISKVETEAKECMAKREAEQEKQGKIEDEEYVKCFEDTLLPTINNQPCNWEDEIENPANTEMKFKAINAIGAGGYYKDKSRMRAEIAAKYLNSTLEFWQRLGKTYWRIYARYRLR